MKIAITGGAGFIGSNLVHFLVQQRPSWEIAVFDALTYAGNLENISDLIQAKKIEFIKVDITDSQALHQAFEVVKPELVFHLAAESHVDRSIESAGIFVRTNVLGTQNLLNEIQARTGTRFVHISTDEVYGSLGPTGYFLENTPLDPTSPYAASKAASDLLVLAAIKTHSLDALITRCTNNYGPYQFPEKFIPLFVTHALEDQPLPLYGDGLNVRSWLHVLDHCAGLLLVAEKGRRGEVYNLGGAAEAEVPNRIMAEKILKLLGKPDSLIQYVTDRPAHDRRYAIDYTKMNKELGWSPQVDLDLGLSETVNWYRQNVAWWKNVQSGDYLRFYELNYSKRGKDRA